MTSKEASEKIMQFVDMAKKENENAYMRFTNHKNSVERRISDTCIDIYGGSSLHQISGMLDEVREIAENYYVSSQSLVRMVDDECKSFLTFAPYKRTVEAVAKLLENLNEAASININFSASLNGGSSDDFGRVHYEPSLESKMIQKFWEQKARMMTESEEEKEIIKAEKEKKEKAAKKDEDERLEYEAELKKYNDWESECKKIKKLQQKWKDKKVAEKREELEEELQDLFAPKAEAMKNSISELEKEKEKLEKELSELGFFSFGAKSEKKKRIEEIETSIYSEQQNMISLRKEYEEEESKLADKLSKYRKSLKTEDSGFVAPQKLKKPEMPACMLKERVLEILSNEMGEGLTISRISERLGVDSNATVAGFLEEFMDKGYVSRYMDRRVYYYCITDEYYNR